MPAWKPNIAAVAAKVIDGEAIIMNLTNGAYYSMDGVGAAIWECIELAQRDEAIVMAIADRFGADPVRVQADFDRLIRELLADGLILETSSEGTATPPGDGTKGTGYVSPVLNKYTEMADLLALDPPMPALEEVSGEAPRAG